MDRQPDRSTAGPNRRAVVAVSIFVLQTAGSGIAVYAVPIYIAAFLRLNLLSSTAVTVASTVFFLVSAMSGVVFGRLGRRFTIPCLVAAASVSAGAVASMALWPVTPVLVACFALLGLSFNGIVIVGTTVLVRIFDGRPTSGMAAATSGSSAGGIFVSPFLVLLLGGAAPTRGLLVAAVAFAVVSMTVIAVCRWGLARVDLAAETAGGRDRRAELRSGRTRRADPAGDVGRAPERQPPPTMGRQWPLLVGFCLVTASQLAATSYVVAVAASRGFTGASLAVMVTTGSAVASRLIGSVGIRRLGLQRWTAVCFVLQAIGVVMIGASGAGWMLFVGSALVGQCLGNTLLIRSQVVVDIFGMAAFPRRFGQFMTLTSLGSALGPLTLGSILTATGSYTWGYLGAFALNVISTPFLIPWIRRGDRPAVVSVPDQGITEYVTAVPEDQIRSPRIC